jgi:hypothetical protein
LRLFDEYHILIIPKQNLKSYHTINVHRSPTFLPSILLPLSRNIRC